MSSSSGNRSSGSDLPRRRSQSLGTARGERWRTGRAPSGPTLLAGDDALVELASRDDVDMVVVGTGGVVSLRPILAALDAGKVVATANKETLVAGGHLVMPRARAPRRRHGAPGRPPTRWPARSAGCARSTPSTPRSGSASPARTSRTSSA